MNYRINDPMFSRIIFKYRIINNSYALSNGCAKGFFAKRYLVDQNIYEGTYKFQFNKHIKYYTL